MTRQMAEDLFGKEEVLQALSLAGIEGQSMGSALDSLARSYGWRRVKLSNGQRKWLSEMKWIAHVLSTPGYLYNVDRKREARSHVSASRRKEIASMGGRKSHAKEKD